MNQQERSQVVKIFVTLSEIYNRQFSRDALALMADALMDLDGPSVIKALSGYLNDSGSRGFPLPGQVRALVSPQASNDQLALEAANKIIEAMARFGWTNPEKAREFMGPIAWQVVIQDGGWVNLCERTKNDDLPILRAQWRQLAGVVAIRQKQKESFKNQISFEEKKEIEG